METNGLEVMGTTTSREKRGIQWNRFQIRVMGRVDGTMKKNLISDGYHDN
jgi:hypothetical protein